MEYILMNVISRPPEDRSNGLCSGAYAFSGTFARTPDTTTYEETR